MRTTARMLVLLGLATAGPHSLQAGPLEAVEGVSSTVIERDQSSFSGLGLRLQIQPPWLADGFSLVPALEYWRNHSKVEAFGIASTRKDATLAGFLRYDFRRQGWQPYVGAGLGMHFISSEVVAPALGLNDASDSLIKGGVLILGGVRFGLAGKLGNLIELEYHHLPDHGQLKINWGLSVGL